MTLSRRRFLGHATPLGLVPFLPGCGSVGDPLDGCCGQGEASPFLHGVASGDPLPDAVILWTRVTLRAAPGSAELREADVDWRMATDPGLTAVVASGSRRALAEDDYTIKVDVSGLSPSQTYYYDFAVQGARSGVGRTKTLPIGPASRARVALTSCANYPAGYFTAYRLIAARADLDLVLHLGDYLYEYANGSLGDGSALGRIPEPNRELLTLEEYRARHAQYKRDPDLQAVHRQHPFLAIWDDHEVANNAYRDGAGNHQEETEGDWAQRKQSAMRAYFEWMPIRPSAPANVERIYRAFAYGELFDLVLLDTRFAGRDAGITSNCDTAGIDDAARALLGDEQEAWFFEQLVSSRSRGARWRLVAQQVMMGQLSDTREGCVTHPDQWDGYAQSRARVLGLLRDEAIDNVVILTGDAHSSWAMDLALDPFDPAAYDPETGEGSLAVELVTPSVSSPVTFGAATESAVTHPHLKFKELLRHGYVLVDVTAERVQAEWYLVSSVSDPAADETLAALFQARSGDNHLTPAQAASEPRVDAAPLAP